MKLNTFNSSVRFGSLLLSILLPLAVIYELFVNGSQGDEFFVIILGAVLWIISLTVYFKFRKKK